MSEQEQTKTTRFSLPETLAPHVSTEFSPVEEGETKWRIFLNWTTDDILDRRQQMLVMLEKAGMEVFPKEPCPTDEATFKKKVGEHLQKADATLTLMGGEYGKTIQSAPETSWLKYQYEQATLVSKQRPGKFKRLVWNFPLEGMILEGDQMRFMNDVQNNLTTDVMFTTVNNAAQLIDDIRTFLDRDVRVKELPKEYDMAFISNVQDAAECYHVIEKLSETLKLTTLTVVPENDTDYRKEAADQILRSRMTVVFFKDASDWAISFVKQLWKHVGGASTDIPFLVIGEDDPRRNRFLRFKAPQTLLQVVPKEIIFETLKATYDRVAKTGSLTEDRFCPYTGLRPFNEDESIFFKGREGHADFIINMLQRQKFAMVTGSSGDGKSSLVFAGVLPNLKSGFLTTQFSKWAIADMRPERQPLRNLASSIADQMRIRKVDEVENALSYGFSALIDLYKKSDLYCDMTSEEWLNASEDERRGMRRKAANLLILVDQFEEFFTNLENYRDGVASPLAQITVNVLVETIRIAREEDLPVYVVCTMRSDYIGQCVAFRGFAEMIGLSTYYVPRLKREEIQEVIEAPAKLNGDKISLRLTQRLLNDLGDGIDQLPVLQHCLHQVWTDAAEGRQEMDLVHYSHVGGLSDNRLPKEYQHEFAVWFANLPEDKKALFEKPRLRNVLNRHANELYETSATYYNSQYEPQISKEKAQAILKSVFTCLTKIDENRAVRNRMTLQQIAEIHGDEDVDFQTVGHVINLYREPGNTFVQPFITDDPESRELTPNTVLDITHESLIRNWERLVEWAEAENKSSTVFNDFKVQVNRWISNDCDPKYLLASGPYNYFSGWFKEQQPSPAWIRRYMLPEEISSDADPMEQAAEYLLDMEFFLQESKRRLDRNKRLRNIATIVITALFFAALLLAAFAYNRMGVAVEKGKEAERNLKLAEVEKLRANIAAREAKDQELNAQLAAIDARRAAIEAEQQKNIAQGEKLNAEVQTELAKLAAQEAKIQTQLAENERAKAEDQRKLAEINAKEAERQTAIAKIQSRNAVIQKENAFVLQSLFLSSLSEEQTDLGKPDIGLNLALAALPAVIGDSSRPYVEEAEAALYYALDAIANKEPKVQMFGHKNKVIYNQFSPDSKQLITTSWDKTAKLWDVKSGREVSQLTGHTNVVERAYFSSDGRYIVTFGDDFSARLWDFKAGREIHVFKGHSDVLTHASISNDGSRVLTTSADGTARLWDVVNGNEIATLAGHTGTVLFGNFNNESSKLVTCGSDNIAILWDAKTGQKLKSLAGHGGAVNHATFSPTGFLVATVSNDNTSRVWNAATGQNTVIMSGHRDDVLHVTFSPDGTRLATASKDSTARVWNVQDGKYVGLLKGHTDAVYHVEYSNDGLHLLTTSEDRTVRLWDAQAFLRLSVYKGHPGLGYFATFSPDSKLIATAGFVDNAYTIRVFDVFDARQPLLAFSKKFKKRDLSEAEREQFFLADKRLRPELEEAAADFQDYQERKGRLNEPIPGETTPRGPSTTPTKPAATVPPSTAGGTQPDPAPTTQRTAPASQPKKGKPIYYEVKQGDTFWSIAKKHNTTVAELQKLNGIRPEELRPGIVMVVGNQ